MYVFDTLRIKRIEIGTIIDEKKSTVRIRNIRLKTQYDLKHESSVKRKKKFIPREQQ